MRGTERDSDVVLSDWLS